MSKHNLFVLLIGGIILIVFSIYLFLFEERVFNFYSCKELNAFQRIELNCIVENKYIDFKNHSFRTINFENCENFILTNDTSGFYEFIIAGDSVFKKLDSDIINIIREGDTVSFRIYFGCEN